RRVAIGALAEPVDLGLAGVVEPDHDAGRDLSVDHRLDECGDGVAVRVAAVARGLQGRDGLPGATTTGTECDDNAYSRDAAHRRRLKGMRAVCNCRQRV